MVITLKTVSNSLLDNRSAWNSAWQHFKGAQGRIASLLGEVGWHGMSSEDKVLLNAIHTQTQRLPLGKTQEPGTEVHQKAQCPTDLSDFGLTPTLLITRGKRTSFYRPNNPKPCLQLFNKAKIISRSFLFLDHPQPMARGVDYSAADPVCAAPFWK